MKKLIIAAMAMAVGAAASAKTADELRVYINPGHGSWTANDRPCTLVGHGAYSRTNTDTLSFFESNTNLRKGFGVLEKLREYGLKYDATLNQTGERWQIGAARDMSNNIVMSHVKCGPYHDDNGTSGQLGDAAPADLAYYNRSLTEISQEVDANNFDMFISIHSNAATEGSTSNYPLFLYRGYDTPKEGDGVDVSLDMQQTSVAIAKACWDYAYANKHMMWTAYNTGTNIRGDLNFYGSGSTGATGAYGYLGVLKHHCPGFLVEGYFHTYQPARHKAMNFDTDYIEGYAYAHGIADYFGLKKESTGDIYGVVRDLHERFTDAAYTPNPTTDDKFMPLNGVKVILHKGDKEVATYTTDNYYNGAFVFKGVEPGTYTITFESADYKPLDEPLTVEVVAANTVFPTAQLESVNYVPPTVVYEDYPNEYMPGSAVPADEYNFESVYADQEIAELAGKTVRRTVYRNGNVYILALDAENNPTILVVNGTTHEVTNVSVEGIEKGKKASDSAADEVRLLAVGDIQVTADGYLLASNVSENTFTPENEMTIYKWENDKNGIPTGNAAAWISTIKSGNMYNAYTGDTFAYQGTTTEGNAYISSETCYDSHKVFLSTISVVDGAKVGEGYDNKLVFTSSKAGADYRLIASPFDKNSVIIVGINRDDFDMAQYTIGTGENNTWTTGELPEGTVANVGLGGVNFFKYIGATYAAVPVNTADGNTGVAIVDVTNGLANAKVIKTVGTEKAAAEGLGAALGTTMVERDLDDKVTNGYMDLYVVRNGAISKVTTNGVTQPRHRSEQAYALAMTETDGVYEFTYKVTGDVVDSKIILTPAEEGKEVVEIPVGAVTKAEGGKVQYNAAELSGSYTWAVEVQSPVIASTSAYLTPSYDFTLPTRGGVVTITDPEYDTFGYTVVSQGKGNGFELYTPDDQFVGRYHTGAPFNTSNNSSAFRGDQLHGKAVFADWSDSNSGYFILDPANMEADPVQMLQGTRKSTGAFEYNGAIIGGGSSCVAFQGKGENTKMYTFEEDCELLKPNGDNILVRYDLGDSETIVKAPDYDFDRMFTGSSFMYNTNVEVVPTEDGMFVAQVRSQGNNSSSVPAFVYINNDGDILLNSADIDGLDSGNSGVALNKEKTLAAIGTYTAINIYDVTWNGAKPELSFKYEIPLTDSQWTQLKFDNAGNLHGYIGGRGYRMYSLVNAEPRAITPAKSTMIVEGTGSAVIDIDAAEEVDAPEVYYNLQGVRVAADALTPGIYVKVKGTTATKVVVK